MDIASLISFGILLLAWLVLPVKDTEPESLGASAQKLLSSKQTV